MPIPVNRDQGRGPVLPRIPPPGQHRLRNVARPNNLGAHRVDAGAPVDAPIRPRPVPAPRPVPRPTPARAPIPPLVQRPAPVPAPRLEQSDNAVDNEYTRAKAPFLVLPDYKAPIPTPEAVRQRVQDNQHNVIKYTSVDVKPLPALPATTDPQAHQDARIPNRRASLVTVIAPLTSAVKRILRLIRFQQNFDTVQVGSNQAVVSKKYGTFIDLSPQEYANIIKAAKKKLGMRSYAVITHQRVDIPVTYTKTVEYNPHAGNDVAKVSFSVPPNVVLSATERQQLIENCQLYKNDSQIEFPFVEDFTRPALEIEVIARRSFMMVKSLDLLITDQHHFADGGFGTVHTVTNISTGKQATIEKRAKVDRQSPVDVREATAKFNDEIAIYKTIHQRIRKTFKKNRKLFPNAFNIRRKCLVIARIDKINKKNLSFSMKKYEPFFDSKEAKLVDKNKFNRLNDKNKFKLVSTMAAGPALLHDIGIVHRDIKLENYLMDKQNHAVVADFGESITLKRPGWLHTKLTNAEKMNPFEGKNHTEEYMSLPLAQKLKECITGNPKNQREEFNELLRKMDGYAAAVSIYLALTKTEPFDRPQNSSDFPPPVTIYPTVAISVAGSKIDKVELIENNVSTEIPENEWQDKVPNYREFVKNLGSQVARGVIPPRKTYIGAVKLMGFNLAGDAFERRAWKECVPDELKGLLKGLLEGTADSTDNTANLAALSIAARKLSKKCR